MTEIIALGVVVFINLALAIYSYGKITQQVDNLQKQTDQLANHVSTIAERLSKIEGKLERS